MSRDLSLLQPSFRVKVEEVLADCRDLHGLEMWPFFTARSPVDQARLWRQSRSSEVIKNAIAMLERNKAPFLANCLASVGPQSGRWATNALPGQSWHQYGLAVDCFALVDGEAVWNSNGLYRTYADVARSHGLTAGFYFGTSDGVHIQEPRTSAPDMTWAEIDAEMQRIWGKQVAA